jgi:1,4-alpha-glucan branching enzyme
MNTIYDKPGSELYSAKHSLKPVNFYCDAPGANQVKIAGDFNHWFPVPMQRRVDGWWYVQMLLNHGHHQYRFVVDGVPRLDPQAMGTTRNEEEGEVSVVAVS